VKAGDDKAEERDCDVGIRSGRRGIKKSVPQEGLEPDHRLDPIRKPTRLRTWRYGKEWVSVSPDSVALWTAMFQLAHSRGKSVAYHAAPPVLFTKIPAARFEPPMSGGE
jgi:hypothetical protein